MEKTYPMVAKTFQGLEDVLRDELISLGAENVETGRRMVSFEGDLELMYKANLCCRTALRVLKPIEKFTAYNPDELYDMVRDIPWEKYMTPQTTFMIDSTVNSGDFPHSKFVTYRVKDGIVDHFRDMSGERPSVRVTDADLMLNVHIDSNRVTISLDSSGEPLSKRGYRDEQTEAPINEVLAAGIIMLTGWRGESNFVDPMCGSGTFLIEAALIAANINPGIYRKGFAFEKWPDFDKDLFEDLYNDDSQERDFNFKIYGGDIDPEAVQTSRRNIKSAQVDDMIELSCRNMSEWTDNPEPGVLVMNPPYGRRLKPDDIEILYRSIGTNLKRNFSGWQAWVIGLDDPLFDNIGLKPSTKIPLLNGSLECMLREYVMFDGRYNDFRAEGGMVKGFEDDSDKERGPRKMKRISDEDWRNETRKFGHNDRKPRPYHKDEKGGRDERRDSKKRDERRDFKGRDERKDFKGRDEHRDFKGRDERKDFKGRDQRKDFKGRDERRDFKGHEGERKDWRGNKKQKGMPDWKKPREIIDRGPQIGDEHSVVINPVHYRKRKNQTEE